ncbi:MAG: hypothetical protein Q9178_007154 [Gyalolechia marmorata]
MASFVNTVPLVLMLYVVLMPWWTMGQDVMLVGEEAILMKQALTFQSDETEALRTPAHSYRAASLSAELGCPYQPYRAHVFSEEPLMIYIEDFVSLHEAEHLIELATPGYSASQVSLSDDIEGHGRDGEAVNEEARSSQSAFVTDDAIVACIEARATDFQGVSTSRLERFQVVRYGVSDFFGPHYDWYGVGYHEYGKDRETTFFVYLAANCTGGATQFPEWPLPEHLDDWWCGIINCERSRREGLTYNVRPGDALFWRNLDDDGHGIHQTLHAGLPLASGYKIGLNIWTQSK